MKSRALAAALLFVSSLPGAAVTLPYIGTGFFSAPINWSSTGDLYFSVAGGPANTCGALSSTRNGQILFTSSWICTDANGNATKGPWTWAGTSGNQTDKDLQILWPGGGATAPVNHVWDKTCPTVTRTSSVPVSGPPSSFAGRANDAQWSAGFNTNWSQVNGYFWDKDSNTYWKPGLTGYSSPATTFYWVAPNVTGWPLPGGTSLQINWSFSQVPPPEAHIPGHRYEWFTGVSDGDRNCGPGTFVNFTAP